MQRVADGSAHVASRRTGSDLSSVSPLTRVRKMDAPGVATVRRFSRVVTQRLGALNDEYLARPRPLGASRVLYEIGEAGADARTIRGRLGLDSGYLSRLLRRLEDEHLHVHKPSERTVAWWRHESPDGQQQKPPPPSD